MRYAIVSDIHANWQAWNATLLDIRSLKVDHIICLGDLIGYGPNPAEVFQSAHANVDYFVLGNHDAVLVGMMDASLFNDRARIIIEWTAGRLNDAARDFLRQIPLCLAGDGFRCTHGDFVEPGAFNYVIETSDAGPSLRETEETLLFVGHTHCPGVFVRRADGSIEEGEPVNFVCQPGERYLVNVGSVGQPRDKEARASYVIFDTETQTISWRRIPFDIDAYRAAVRAAGIAEEASPFLVHDPRQGRAPLRETLNFSPPRSPEQGARSAVEVRDIKALRRSMRKWQVLTVVVTLIAILSIAVAGAVWWNQRPRGIEIPDPHGQPILSAAVPAERNLLPEPAITGRDNLPIAGWTIRLGEATKQGVQVVAMDDPSSQPPEPGPALAMRSPVSGAEIRLASAPITVSPDMRMELTGFFRLPTNFTGQVQLLVWPLSSVSPEPGAPDPLPLFSLAPNISRKNGWLQAKRSFSVPARTAALRVVVRGTFSGEVLCQGLSLRVKAPPAPANRSEE